jgi:NAD(P)-dependent dehydrogenase (short-subunit alcohol dehydrogenase family)
MGADLFDLGGKVAVVTGASRGIGAATARLLARHGARVVVSSRKVDDCEIVAREIRDQGGEAHAMGCHIGDMEQIHALFGRLDETFGRVDILVNNAAANPYYGHILDTDLGAFQKTVDVNIRGYFFMCVEAGKRMRSQGGGAIINVASVNGVRPGPMQGIYSVTKAAVINMTQSFAKECGQFNIRVNALLPGLTRTKFATALTENEKARDYYLGFVPLGRMAEPEEMAGAVLFLASDASSYATGSCVTADGGYLA